MARIIWDVQFDLGIEKIDTQHQRLCALFNAINAAMETGQGIKVYAEAVNEMLDYANTHFELEEQLMAAANFPGLAAHQAEHETFFRKAREFQLSSEKTREVYETIKIVNFLWDWFLEHIQKTDRQYMSVIK